MAFPKDKEILQVCATEMSDKGLLTLLELLPKLCLDRNLKLYAIFDQHDGLTPELRCVFPFNIIQDILPSIKHWKSALVVISATANNEYQLKVAVSNQWPQFVINHGLNEEEFQEWVNANNFFIGEDLERVEYWTERIPFELRLLLEAKSTLLNRKTTATVNEVIDLYLEDRFKVFRAQQELFANNHLKSTVDMQRAIKAVTLMTLELNTAQEDIKINQQLMYEENSRIYCITPLAKTLLIKYWTNTN